MREENEWRSVREPAGRYSKPKESESRWLEVNEKETESGGVMSWR